MNVAAPTTSTADARAMVIRCTIARHLGTSVAQTTPEARLNEDLKADDLDRSALMALLEREFAVTITEDDEAGCCTVADCIRLIEQRNGRI